jgi:FSR family fosmidomycin resistance protein-like MFS transporter
MSVASGLERVAVGMQALERRRRTLTVACFTHALHDGFTDLLYILLPIWQVEFGLGYAAVGTLRALYSGTMAGLQVPSTSLAARFGGPVILAAGTALAAIGYLIAGASTGFALLAAALVIGGLGSSTQHPIASSLVAHAFEGASSRAALGTYNFAGDLGKMVVPAATALLVTLMPWRSAVLIIGSVGLVVAVGIRLSLRQAKSTQSCASVGQKAAAAEQEPMSSLARGGFPVLLAIGVIDSATRMGFLTFLPFLLKAKGAELPTVGLALTLIFAGGAAGKLVCGFLGARLGVVATVFLTEGMTALGLLALLPLPLDLGLILLPAIGIALNGTSSVLYGTVPEIVPTERRERAFGVFYTGAIGAGALSPVLYGMFSDAVGVPVMMQLIAAVVLATLPLAWVLRYALKQS